MSFFVTGPNNYASRALNQNNIIKNKQCSAFLFDVAAVALLLFEVTVPRSVYMKNYFQLNNFYKTKYLYISAELIINKLDLKTKYLFILI